MKPITKCNHEANKELCDDCIAKNERVSNRIHGLVECQLKININIGNQMGDHRLNVKISIVGSDGKEAKIDWWVNWWPDKPEKLYLELVEKAKSVGLDVDERFTDS